MIYTNRADVLEAAAKSMRIQEATGLDPECRVEGRVFPFHNCSFWCGISDYSFPIAIVECKPVYEDSIIYEVDSEKVVDTKTLHSKWDEYSWNPLTPKTVKVELPIKDVEYWLSYRIRKLPESSTYNIMSNTFYDACHKALDKLEDEE